MLIAKRRAILLKECNVKPPKTKLKKFVKVVKKSKFGKKIFYNRCICPRVYRPVCGDGVTYSNKCSAQCAKSKSIKLGRCNEVTKCK